MLAMEPSQSLVKRSTSIWRRLSKREPRPKAADPENVETVQRLQRRATQPCVQKPNKQMIAHLERVEAPAKRLDRKAISTKRALASDMRTTPFPQSSYVRTVPWNVFLNPEQVYRLVMGFCPWVMEDKWFIYSQGPDQSGKLKVHFHRSWTGLKMAELFVVIDLKGEGAGKIVGIKWNGTDETNGMDEEEAKYMVSTTCSWMLGVQLEKRFL